jgi:hypothetical protein
MFLLFFHYWLNALDVVVTLIDDQRHSFHHHHGCVEAQSLWLVNAYLADELSTDNKRYAALLTEAMALTDYWADLTSHTDWSSDQKSLREFDTRLRLFREDTRLFQEDLEAEAAERRAIEEEQALIQGLLRFAS